MTVAPVSGLTPPPPSADERWRRVPLGWRIVMIVVALVIGAELVSSTFSGVTGGKNGASGPSSSYDTSPSGTAALARLLAARGHRVDQLTQAIGITGFPGHTTVFVLDPTTWTASDTHGLDADLSHGDRVIIGGPSPGHTLLPVLLGLARAPVWMAGTTGSTHPVSRLPEVAGVTTVIATGEGRYASPPVGDNQPVALLAGANGILALASAPGSAAGRGTVVLLASSTPLQNSSLGLADNAAFALDLVPSGSEVVIDEYDHGFGQPGSGLAGLPASWRWGLGILLVAIVVWVLSAARRFGPPDPPGRITVPPRVLYVDAMATLLSTRPAPELTTAVAPVYIEARRRLCQRLGVPTDASDDVLRNRLSHGWDATQFPDGMAQSVLRAPQSSDDVVAVGVALSELDREARDQ